MLIGHFRSPPPARLLIRSKYNNNITYLWQIMKGWVFIADGLVKFESYDEEVREDGKTYYKGKVIWHDKQWQKYMHWYPEDRIFKTKKAAIESL